MAETFAPAGNGVAIVGAGAAGLAAAAELRAHGVPALVLEARGRTGGRAFTDVSVPGAPFDRGASYIHAADQGNPWAAIARAAGADVTLDGRRRLFLDRGRPLDPAPFEAALAPAWRSLAQAGSAGWQGAAGALLSAESPADHHARAMVGPWLSGAGADDLDAADFAAAREGEDWLVPGGYGRLVARSGAGLPVRLGCPVTSIRTLPGRVELATAQGVLTADQAIVTVPLGVLAAGRLRFEPPPPAAVLAAIEALPMGNLVKLRVRLAGDPFGAGDGFYASAPPTGERAVLWLVRPFGRDELMGFVGGGRAAELTALPPAGLAAEVKRELALLAGSAAARQVRSAEAADWRRDPWSLGSYAVARPGAAGARAALRRPFSERVRYAGEAAAADGWHGTVAGAHLSGRAAARALLEAPGCRGAVTD